MNNPRNNQNIFTRKAGIYFLKSNIVKGEEK